jgi:hypothetical protein
MSRNYYFERLPKGIRKHIRGLKAKINKSSLSDKEKKEKIKEVYLKFPKR